MRENLSESLQTCQTNVNRMTQLGKFMNYEIFISELFHRLYYYYLYIVSLLPREKIFHAELSFPIRSFP